MKSSKKKFAAILIAATTVISMFTGCNSNSSKTSATSGSSSDSDYKIKWLLPGTDNATLDDYLKTDLNPTLKKEIGAELSISLVPWSEWENKTNLMITSGEQLDICWHNAQGIQNWAAKKMILPLDSYVKKCGSDLLKVNPMSTWQSTVYNNQYYGIPTNTPTSENLGTLCVRQDLLEKVGMTDLKDVDDVTEFATKLVQQNICKNPMVLTAHKSFLRQFSDSITLDQSVLNGWVYVDDSQKDDKVYDYFESKYYKTICNEYRQWNKAGFIPSDYLTNQDETGRMNSGKSAIWTGAISRDMEQQASLQKNVPTGVYKEYILYPDKAKYKVSGGFNIFAIPSTSKKPEKTIEFLNWVYKNQNNYDLTVYGVKGKHYTLESNGRYKLLTSDQMLYEWQFRNIKYMRFDTSINDTMKDRYLNWDNGSKKSKLYGFNFDQTAVTSEIARVQSVITEDFAPMTYGFVDYDTTISKALGDLKNAGMDDILAEFQKQFSEYYSANKK